MTSRLGDGSKQILDRLSAVPLHQDFHASKHALMSDLIPSQSGCLLGISIATLNNIISLGGRRD